MKKAWLAAAALLLLSTWEIATLLRVHAAAPDGDDWSRAEAAVRAGFASGDLVVFAPAWMDPVGREHLGDLLGVHAAARMDAARYGAIWEVSARAATAPEAAGAADVDQIFGSLRVRRVPHVAAHVTWDLAARSRLVEVGYAPHECAPLRPPATLDAGSVPLGTHLAVAAGLADFRARRDNRARAKIRVLVDDKLVAERVIGNDDGFAPLPDVATTPGPHHVVFTSEAVVEKGQPANLDLCVAAEARQ